MELKQYQQEVINDLIDYIEQLEQTNQLNLAFSKFRPVQLESKIFSTAYAASLNSSSLSSNHFLLSLFRCTAVIEAIAIEPFFDQLIPLCF